MRTLILALALLAASLSADSLALPKLRILAEGGLAETARPFLRELAQTMPELQMVLASDPDALDAKPLLTLSPRRLDGAAAEPFALKGAVIAVNAKNSFRDISSKDVMKLMKNAYSEWEGTGVPVRNIIHVSGKVNPADDIEVINTELALADLDTCERAIHRVQKKAKGGDKDAKAELAVLEKCLPQLENAGMLRALDLSAEEKAAIRYLSFLTLKPTMYIANVNEDGFENNPYLDQVREIAAKEGSVVVPVCAAVEADIAELDDEERDEFMQELGLEEPGLNRVIRAGYKLLNLQTYFTAGVKEVRAWTIPVGATAPQAAGKIHTDFEKGFIRAQTISFEDFITYKGEQGAKEAGKMRAEGKDYIVKDGDVMNFLFNV